MVKLLLTLSLVISISVFGQEVPGKARKVYAEGKEAIRLGQTEIGIEKWAKAIEICPQFGLARINLGDIYLNRKDYQKALGVFELSEPTWDNTEMPLYYRMGYCNFALSNYDKARTYLSTFTKSIDAETRLLPTARHLLASIDTAKYLKNNPVNFEPINLGPSVNSTGNEYMPSLSADGKKLVFTKLLIGPNGRKQEDFYFSEDIKGVWSQARYMPGKLNTNDNEGAQSLTADGYALFYTACNRREGLGSCDIYLSSFDGRVWSNPLNLGAPINSNKWESQPSISSDGKTIFYTSNRAGGYGGKDIWKCNYVGGGKWSLPINLGPTINTTGNETAPFLHFDNRTLYFSSDGWPGLGGSDLFVSIIKDNEGLTNPKNLGYPINTFGDETGIFIKADGKTAFFASNNIADNIGGLDLFTFKLPIKTRAQEVAYFKGTIRSNADSKGLSSAITVRDVKTGEIILESASGSTGAYFLVLPIDKNYAFNIAAKEHLFHSERVTVEEDFNFKKAFERDITLSKMIVGASIALENVFFDVNDSKLKEESFPELNGLITLLESNPFVKVEISGHTDNSGDSAYNLTLSQNRAKSVYDYLIVHGILQTRLKYVGFGDTRPTSSNITVKGRSKNRRTEIKIIK
ncbi:MAG: outer membrane protein OmpA-like peptidoglycan-associated protein [Candidatus Azotimanducaceae bacterium]|jgi:outer membrane protein OmpA-like peptidoglycan-associated protein